MTTIFKSVGIGRAELIESTPMASAGWDYSRETRFDPQTYRLRID
jgi:hypothetical protein